MKMFTTFIIFLSWCLFAVGIPVTKDKDHQEISIKEVSLTGSQCIPLVIKEGNVLHLNCHSLLDPLAEWRIGMDQIKPGTVVVQGEVSSVEVLPLGILHIGHASQASSGRYSCYVGERSKCFDITVQPKHTFPIIDDALWYLLGALTLLLLGVIGSELCHQALPSRDTSSNKGHVTPVEMTSKPTWTLTTLGPKTPSILAPPAYSV